MLALLAACQRTRMPVLAPVSNNTYLDLIAGWRVRVVAPVLNDPAEPKVLAVSPDGPLAFSAKTSPNIKGVETQFYELRGRQKRVRLKFARATLAVNGVSQDEAQALKNYFPLPEGLLEIRLIYLARSTDAPHDMAVVFARNSALLNQLGDAIIKNPHECDSNPSGCLWIPERVAVVAEHLSTPGDPNSWQPVR
jgi:hypothetical protein